MRINQFAILLLLIFCASCNQGASPPPLPDDTPAADTTRDRSPSPVYDALSIETIAKDFDAASRTLTPNATGGEMNVLEKHDESDEKSGVHSKLMSVILVGDAVAKLIDAVKTEVTSKSAKDEIPLLNVFEKDIENTIENAGGKVTIPRIVRRGTASDQLLTRYVFHYTSGDANGRIRVWIIGKDDYCTILGFVDEYPNNLRSGDVPVRVLN